MPTLTSPRPDRRRQRTRTALLAAGKALFATRSVDGVSIDDIVARADVAKGSFYNHFPDKDALAHALAEEARAQVEAVVAALSVGVDDPAARVARALCRFARQALEDPDGVHVMLRLFPGARAPDAPLNAGVRADVAKGLASGRFQGVSVEAGVLLAVGVAQIAVARVLTHDQPRKARALAQELVFGLLRGLGLDPTEAEGVAARAAADIFTGPPPAA